LLLAAPAVADEIVAQPEQVFDYGVEWDYRDATGDPAIGDFDAAEWELGPSPFVIRSVQVQDEIEANRRTLSRRRRRQLEARAREFPGTRIFYDSSAYATPPGVPHDYDAGPNTFYFSRTFDVHDLAEVRAAFLEVRFSGGFVAYVNGREWVRHNVRVGQGPNDPAHIVWQPDWVSQTVGNRWQRAYPGLDPSLLREGENRLVIEVHRRATTASNAVYLDAQFRLFRDDGFLRTPYLQSVQRDSVTVMWASTVPSYGYVEFGSGERLERVAVSPEVASTTHEITLTGLVADTRYFYRVNSIPVVGWPTASEMLTSPIHHFRTSVPEGQSFNFIAYGDNRTNTRVHSRLVERMLDDAEERDVRFMIHTGDLTTHGGSWDEWHHEFFGPAARMMADYPLYASLGNHEGNHETWYEFMSLPNNEAWYSFRYGDAQFFSLNSSADLRTGSAQHQWLERELTASDALWKIVFFHHPPFSCVPVRKPGNLIVQEHIVPLLATHGVQLVVLGHDHLYGRSVPIDGVTYVITGGAGASTYPAEADDINEICVQVHHYCILRVSEQAIDLEAIDIDGNLLDAFTLTRD
jgi:predicted phosphodiesterase